MEYRLIQLQKRFRYIPLILSVVIIGASFRLQYIYLSEKLVWVIIPALLILADSLICMWFWRRYHTYEYYCKRIRDEYGRVITKQPYKLERLSNLEQTILLYILEGHSQEEIKFRMHLDYSHLYTCIRSVKVKLDVPTKESFADIDWQKIFN